MQCFWKCLIFFVVTSALGTTLVLGVTGVLIGAAMLSAYVSSIIGDNPMLAGIINITIFVMILAGIYTVVDHNNICKRS